MKLKKPLIKEAELVSIIGKELDLAYNKLWWDGANRIYFRPFLDRPYVENLIKLLR